MAIHWQVQSTCTALQCSHTMPPRCLHSLTCNVSLAAPPARCDLVMTCSICSAPPFPTNTITFSLRPSQAHTSLPTHTRSVPHHVPITYLSPGPYPHPATRPAGSSAPPASRQAQPASPRRAVPHADLALPAALPPSPPKCDRCVRCKVAASAAAAPRRSPPQHLCQCPCVRSVLRLRQARVHMLCFLYLVPLSLPRLSLRRHHRAWKHAWRASLQTWQTWWRRSPPWLARLAVEPKRLARASQLP